jgi:hypothetical protein
MECTLVERLAAVRGSIRGTCGCAHEVRLNKRDEGRVIKDFEFEDQGHVFCCATEKPSHAGLQTWWWFTLDGDKTTRYAPFEESAEDTEQSVKTRIVAYYAELLAIRARPVRDRGFWRKPQPQS